MDAVEHAAHLQLNKAVLGQQQGIMRWDREPQGQRTCVEHTRPPVRAVFVAVQYQQRTVLQRCDDQGRTDRVEERERGAHQAHVQNEFPFVVAEPYRTEGSVP